MKKVYEKLVRDNIPDIIKKSGKDCVIEIMDDVEYVKELNKKLAEEVDEYLSSGSIEEIADIMEVIYSILEVKNISFGILLPPFHFGYNLFYHLCTIVKY